MTWFVNGAEHRADDPARERAQAFTAARGGPPPPSRPWWVLPLTALAAVGAVALVLWMLAAPPKGAADMLKLAPLALAVGGLVGLVGDKWLPQWSHNIDDLDAARVGLGPIWRGDNAHLFQLHALRGRALVFALVYLGLGALALWGFVSGPRGMVPQVVVNLLLLFALVLGAPALLFAFLAPETVPGNRWSLDLRDGRFHYQAASYWWPLVAGKASWSAGLDDVARVEAGARAEWQPTRPGFIGKRPTPRDEWQTFLFLSDGSRRVVATVHEGREEMLQLAHSIRSYVLAAREAVGADRADRQAFDRGCDGRRLPPSGEGFNL